MLLIYMVVLTESHIRSGCIESLHNGMTSCKFKLLVEKPILLTCEESGAS